MAEKISDQEIIQGLSEIASSLWGKLLDKQPLTDQDKYELIRNTAYDFVSSQNIFTLAEQKLEGTAPIYLSVYEEVLTLMTAIPAIQKMRAAQGEAHWNVIPARKVFDQLSPQAQEAVSRVLALAQVKQETAQDVSLSSKIDYLLGLLPATEPASVKKDLQWLDGIRQTAAQAASAFGGAVQNLINRFMGGGRSQGQ
jgi:hypothetical protein